jgi:GAF domain-containing protein
MRPKSSFDELTSVVVRLRGMLLPEEEATAAVAALARAAHQIVETAAGAGVSLIDDSGHRTSTASTDTLVEIVDALQYQLGEGPCLSAWATQVPQRIDDTTKDSRWARWQAAAADAGIRSMLSVPLVYRGHALGALKVYARNPGVFGEAEERLLTLLAEPAATLLGAAHPVDAPVRFAVSLQEALQSRETITLATGVLMARDHLDGEAARSWLMDQARIQRRPMTDVAAELLSPE